MCGRCGKSSGSNDTSDESDASYDSDDSYDVSGYELKFDSHDSNDSSADESTDGAHTPVENLARLLTPLENDYLEHCRAVMTRLTGEKFIAGPAPWFALRSAEGTVQMSTDGYCEKLGMLLEYMGDQWDFLEEDVWSLALSANIPMKTAFAEMAKYVFRARVSAGTTAGKWQIFIPKPADLPRVLSSMYGGNGPTEMTLGNALEEYLGRRLHQLTVYLPFVGGPRCTCVSKRDPNPAGLNIRQMIKLEQTRDLDGDLGGPDEHIDNVFRAGVDGPSLRPGQSILELLGS